MFNSFQMVSSVPFPLYLVIFAGLLTQAPKHPEYYLYNEKVVGNYPNSWPPSSQQLVDRSALSDCSILLSYVILQRVKRQYFLPFSIASAWAIGYLLQLVRRLLSHWSVTVAHLQNQRENHMNCKPKGYVITACSGLGYRQTGFSANLPFEKYTDILCLLPLC